MTLRLFDTASRGVREFQPGTPGKATVSLCGGGAAGTPHLGQLRSAVCFDILVRWLEASGLRVTYCRSVADIDDEILAAAAAAGAPWWTLAERHEREFAAARARLGCRAPDAEPRAAGHVPDMLVLVERLLASGHAYQAGGDVYFSAAAKASAGPGRAASYGTLSGPGREQRDFVLWRAAKPGEPSWQSPWGRGRPGRPVGCAAMAAGYLGPEPDIHGGGQDLVFPHHENERALSGAAGTGVARYWVHHGLVTVGGTKMSRPAGNALTLPDALREVRPQELRYYLAQPHYRSPVDYSPAALRDAAAAYRRIERFVTRASAVLGSEASEASENGRTSPLPLSFTAALDDDLCVPAALAAVHATVRDGNYALSTGDRDTACACLSQARAMLAVLGLDPLAPAWPEGEPGSGPHRLPEMVDALVVLALGQREAARGRGDYAAADSIRDTLENTGVLVEDTPDGPRWELAR